MKIVVVPDSLREAINEKLDAAFEQAAVEPKPEERESTYSSLLAHFNEHGEIPEFTITKKGTDEQTESRSS